MGRKPPLPIVKVSEASKNQLKALKKKLKLSSVDSVITRLLDCWNNNAAPQRRERGAGRGPVVEEEPVPDRFSYDGFARQPRVREYFCGLPDNGYEWLYQQLRPQVCLAVVRGGSCWGFFFVFVLQLR